MTKRETLILNAIGLAFMAMPSLSSQTHPTMEESQIIVKESNKQISDNPVIVDVTTLNAGELASKIGDQLMEMDSLIVRGPIDERDFRTMWEAGLKGNLSGINLAFSNPKDQAIPDSAFYHKSYQSSGGILPLYVDYITLPANLEKIGNNAFHLVAIKELNLPPTVKSIGKEAFAGCRWITTERLQIPEGVEIIPYCCFRQCFGIASFALPSTIKELEPLAFFNTYMKSINLPDGLEIIGEEAFFMNEEVTELTVPESCTFIGERAFGDCYSLLTLNLPSSLETIPSRMLENSYSIQEFEFPSALKEIGNGAFAYCRGLTQIILPEGLEYIDIYAFRDCTNIEEAYFPSTLKSIQAGAAMGWEHAKRIYCSATIPPQALTTNGIPTLTPFGYYDEDINHYATPRNTPLYVPTGTAENYRRLAGWDYFTNIIDSDDFAETIAIPNCSTQEKDAIFDLEGRQIENPNPGQIYIKGGYKIINRK